MQYAVKAHQPWWRVREKECLGTTSSQADLAHPCIHRSHMQRSSKEVHVILHGKDMYKKKKDTHKFVNTGDMRLSRGAVGQSQAP